MSACVTNPLCLKTVYLYKDACIKANYQHVLDLFDLCIVAPSAA